jgi:flagellar FliJ protein
LTPLARRELTLAMKLNDTLLKLRRFEANEKQQKVADIEMMIADFKRMTEDLNHQIRVEEETSGVRDVNHFSYPTYAKAARKRRENLLDSIRDLEAKLEEARNDLAETFEELKKSEMVEERSLIDHDRSAAAPHAAQDLPALRIGTHY